MFFQISIYKYSILWYNSIVVRTFRTHNKEEDLHNESKKMGCPLG